MRTTNSIESTFAAVRLCMKVTKGADFRSAGLAIQARWRAVNAPDLVRFERSVLVECFEAGAA